MKKTIAALAVMGAFAGAASAADVTLYGIVDTGLMYKWQDTEGFYNGQGVDSDSQFTMESGMNYGSRFGLKGSEDLGNGMTVSFVLENGFSSDSGALKYDNRLFGRESSVSLSGAFGKVSFGRMVGVASSAGSYDIVYATADAFDGGDNNILGLAISDRYDNMVTYQTPVFAGVQATAQYSFKENAVTDTDGEEGKSSTDRYGALAVTGNFGALNLVGAWEMQIRNNASGLTKDGHTFYVGGNYDCGFAKTFVLAQYFMNGSAVGAFGYDDIGYGKITSEGFDGFGLHVGTQFPALGGNMTVGLYYVDATAKGTQGSDSGDGWSYNADFNDVDTTYYGIAGRYEYSLSKRTSVYTGAGYYQLKADAFSGSQTDKGSVKSDRDYKDQLVQAYVGLTHKF